MKVCDQYGICLPIKTYKFEEEVPVVPTPQVEISTAAPDLSNYVTKEELTSLLKELKLNEQSVSTNSTTSKYTTVK